MRTYALVVSVLLLSPSALAEGLELGFRLGYGLPGGDAGEDVEMDELVQRQIPIWIDVGYRVTPALMVGGYGQYGFASMGSELDDFCDLDEVTCSARVVRLGAQLQFHPGASGAAVDTWLGLGIGYEWMSFGLDVDGEDANIELGLQGFEFLNLQGGFDFPMAPDSGVGLGMFASFSVGQYDTAWSECSGSGCGDTDDDSDPIDEKQIHHWFVFGVRGSLVR